MATTSNKVMMAGLATLMSCGLIACQKNGGGNNPGTPAVNDKVNPPASTFESIEVTLKATKMNVNKNGSIGVAPARGYTIKDGQTEFFHAFPADAAYGSHNESAGGFDYFVGDKCRDAQCKEIVTLFARVKDGKTEIVAIAFVQDANGQFKKACTAPGPFEQIEDAIAPLEKACAAAAGQQDPNQKPPQ